MKTFLKKTIEIYNDETYLDKEVVEAFSTENSLLLSSFDSKIKEFEKNINYLKFESNESNVLKTSKKHNTIVVKCNLFKECNKETTDTEESKAIVIFTLNHYSKNFKNIKENGFEIFGLYFDKDVIGCLYRDKNKLNYFIETNEVEVAIVKSVEIDFENYKNIA